MLIAPTTLIAVGAASIWDLRTRQIPNLITFPTIVIGLIFNLYYSGMSGFGNALIGFMLGVLLLLIPFALGMIGAGDVKLLAAVGALNGMAFVLHTFLYSAIAGAVLALIIALIKGQLLSVLSNVWWFFQSVVVRVATKQNNQLNIISSGIKFPYGITFLIGTIVAYWQGW